MKKPRTRLILLPTALTLVGALLWMLFGSISVAAAQKSTVISRAHKGERAPSFTKPIFMLVLGGDARRGNPERVRSDSIHIVAIDPTKNRASILGIPRDSYVTIPGRGQRKINEASQQGGPELMVRTVEQLSGCRFNYYMMTNFEGFRRLVDEFGGITIDVEKRYYEERRSKIDLQPGVQTLDGVDALAYARNRYNRPGGDFDRSESHGTLMMGALGEVRKDYRGDVGAPLKALAVLRRHTKMSIPIAEAFKLGLATMRIDPKNVTNEVVDGSVGNEGGASVVLISESGKAELVDICSDGQLGS